MNDFPKAAPSSTKTDSWENEGGSVTPEQAARELGVVRTMTETFSVGGYRYTNLMHAISEARRMREADKAI